MTLGRSSTGAIKIKTDEEGGGLRAVECACCRKCGFKLSDANVFEITKQEFDSILSGGTWGFNFNYFIFYSETFETGQTQTSTITGSFNGTRFLSGFSASRFFIGQGQWFGGVSGGSTGNSTFDFPNVECVLGFSYEVCKINQKHYVHFTSYGGTFGSGPGNDSIFSTTRLRPDANPPLPRSISIAGNPISSFWNWFGLQSSGQMSLNITFNGL
jgi:hypothetical protein